MNWAFLIGLAATIEVWFIVNRGLGLNADVGLFAAALLASIFAQIDWVRRRRGERSLPFAAQRRILLALEFLLLGTANALDAPHISAWVAAAGAGGIVICQLLIHAFVLLKPRVLRAVTTHSTQKLGPGFVVYIFTLIGIAVAGTAGWIAHSPGVGIYPLPAGFQWPGIALLFVTFGCVAMGLAADRSKGSVVLWLAAAFVVACSAILEWNGQRNWYFLGLSLGSFLFLVPAWPPLSLQPDPQSASGLPAQSN